jgi:hypothetical protein
MSNEASSAGSAAAGSAQKRKPETGDIIVDGNHYYHPFPHTKKPSEVWKFFRCSKELDYSGGAPGQNVFCIKCSSKLKDSTKTIFHTEKWFRSGPTSVLQRHVIKAHKELLESSSASTDAIGLKTITSMFGAKQSDVWSVEKRKKFTKQMVFDFCVRDKEPMAIVEREGFRSFISREFPGYVIPDRRTVGDIVDGIADESLAAVKRQLQVHISKYGTVSMACDEWSKRRRKFVGTALYWVERPSWKLHTAISSCSCLPVGKSANAGVVLQKLEDSIKSIEIGLEKVFAAVSDEGSGMASAIGQSHWLKVPCSAHVQQSTVKDIYINPIKEPILRKNGIDFKANSGTRWPGGDLLTFSEKLDLNAIRELLVNKSEQLHESIMRIEFLHEYNKAGEQLKADESFMSKNQDFHPKTLALRMDIRWNSFAAQLQSILEQTPQIELFIDNVQHLKAADKIPKLDAEYWILVEEHLAVLQLFLHVNLLITVEDSPTLAAVLVCLIMLKEMLLPTSDLVLTKMIRRARSGCDASDDDSVIWTRTDLQQHRLTRSIRAMLLKDLHERYDLEDETRWGADSRQLMICALAMDPRFKEFAVQLCAGVQGATSRSTLVWSMVRDMAIQHWKYEEPAEAAEPVIDSGQDIQSPPSEKRQKSGVSSFMHRYRASTNAAPVTSSAARNEISQKSDLLDAAIEKYKQLPLLEDSADPLEFWRGWDHTGSALEPLLPLAASLAAVPATEAICERLFKAGGMVLTSARLLLLGSRVESLLMCNYNAERFSGIKGVDVVFDRAAGRRGAAGAGASGT